MTIKNVFLYFSLLIISFLNEVISEEEISDGLVSFDLIGVNDAFYIAFNFLPDGSQYKSKVSLEKEKIILNHRTLSLLEFEPTIEKTEYNFHFEERTIEGYKMLTDIYSDNKRNVTMKMYAMKLGSVLLSPELRFGLPFKFEDESNSLAHTLKKKNIIENISFAFCPSYEWSGLGKIVFGGVPPQILRDYQYSGTCRVRRDSVSWACNIKVKVGDAFYNNGKKFISHFDSQIFDIKFPKDFMTFLEKDFFGDALTSMKCTRVNDNEAIDFFTCQRDYIDGLRNLTFYFDDFKISIGPNDLFVHGKSKSFTLFSSEKGREDFSFGTSFLRRFISDFDYEKQKVTIYSHSEVISTINPPFNIRALYIGCIMVLFLGLITEIGSKPFKK